MDTSEDSCYVFLDFAEKLTPNIFTNKMFLRIANLDKPNPLVQINDLVFKGSFDETVGTNLFFEEVEKPHLKTNIFEKNPPIRLKPTVIQSKLIKLKQVKLPRQAPDKHNKEPVVVNLNQDYSTVLERLELGVLNIEDLALKPKESVVETNDQIVDSKGAVSSEPDLELDGFLQGQDPKSLEAKYEKLKRLARRPVRRMKSVELVEDCGDYQKAFEMHNLEKLVCQTSDFFRFDSTPMLEEHFLGGVDIDRCISQGLLPPNFDNITQEQQRKIFSFDNFDNLSVGARYLVLKECLEQIEKSSVEEEMKEVDENGRSIHDICAIFKRLLRVLELRLQSTENEESVRTELIEKFDEDYVKFDGSKDLVVEAKDIFNVDEWIEKKQTEDEMSLDEDSDRNSIQ